jgi:hypothetical protein
LREGGFSRRILAWPHPARFDVAPIVHAASASRNRSWLHAQESVISCVNPQKFALRIV